MKYFGVSVGSSWAKGDKGETSAKTIATAHEMLSGFQFDAKTTLEGSIRTLFFSNMS